MNFKEFIQHERKLDKVIRFSAHPRVKDQTVSQHIFHVSLYAMVLADLERQNGNEVNVEEVLRGALLHDLEESLTGDIIYDFKHRDEHMARQIKEMGKQFLEQIVGNLPEEISTRYTLLWQDAKNERIEGKILKAADKLEALAYCEEEIRIGNKYFERIAGKLKEELKGLRMKSVDSVLQNWETADAKIEADKNG
ncbi:MAG TPA: YfbR-like 5'-deoxynucleotidase [archaeon]|nr:YfbR-like 5'-deoxynucleotidase [archaeon]